MNRRHFLGASFGSIALAAVAPSHLVLARPCAERTEPNIEGPFYRPGAPLRDVLGAGLVIAGTVRDTRCRPLGDATIEVWQADENGEYDLEGDRFRGQLRTGAEHGEFRITTVVPGHYLNGPTYRPAHLHVKVHANGRPPLTTQLYFPGDPYNDSDPWFRPSLVLRYPPSGCGPPRPGRPPMRFDFFV